MWLPLGQPLEPPVLHPPHADQDIYAELRLSSRLEIHISFSSIISNMYRYTVNIQYSILVYQTHYLRAKNFHIDSQLQKFNYLSSLAAAQEQGE